MDHRLLWPVSFTIQREGKTVPCEGDWCFQMKLSGFVFGLVNGIRNVGTRVTKFCAHNNWVQKAGWGVVIPFYK